MDFLKPENVLNRDIVLNKEQLIEMLDAARGDIDDAWINGCKDYRLHVAIDRINRVIRDLYEL